MHELPPSQPQRQVEVQLGHLCNNRCVFCVSGQLSEQGRAPQLAVLPILAQIRAARANGAQRITLLGGEPTIQRSFPEVLAEAVALGFDEVVIFTNGVMTPRASFRQRVMEVLQRLGPLHRQRVLWRFSLQGGDEASHDATTLNPGSWKRILDSMAELQSSGGRLSGNMCVVESNYRTVPELAAVIGQFGLENLHLDMVRPRDAGDRSDAELLAMMARYTDMAPSFLALSDRVDAQLGPHWDLNFGNVPYCTALPVSHRIHHDGQETVTVAADGQGNTQQGFDKYLDKRSDKGKPASCATCFFDGQCSGVFDKYRQFHGDAEFVPVTAAQLWQADTAGHHFVQLVAGPLARLDGVRVVQLDDRGGELEVLLGPWRAVLRRTGRPPRRQGWWLARADRWEVELLGPVPAAAPSPEPLWTGLRAIAGALGTALPQGPGLGSAFRQAQALQAQQRQQTQLRQQAEATASRWRELLGGRPLAVWAPESPGPDGALRWRHGALQFSVVVTTECDAKGNWQPSLRHRAHGVDAAQLAELNQAIAKILRETMRMSQAPVELR